MNMLVNHLRTCGLDIPVGVDKIPVFSWLVEIAADQKLYGKAQSAYRILLSETSDFQAILWDSGKVLSDSPCQGLYSGDLLKSSTTYYWKVRIWDEKDSVSGWSEAASFTTGILREEDWQAKWIDAGELMTIEFRMAPVFRREFSINQELTQAVLHICGLGYYTLEINGEAADDSVLNPANTQFDCRVLYRTYLVKEKLLSGNNAIAVELGNGFWNENSGVWNWQTAAWRAIPKLLIQLELIFEDGGKEVIISDEDWKCTTDGPIRENSIYQGEVFDARRMTADYSKAGFDDSLWKQASAAECSKAELSAQLMQPIRRTNTYAPQSIQKLSDGAYVVTAPEMIAGWIKLCIDEPKNHEIHIFYGEQLEADGHVVKIGKGQGECGEWWPQNYIQHDVFISNGEAFSYEPRYSYKGFRYIEIAGYEKELKAEDVVIYRVANDIAAASSLECSEAIVTGLHQMMDRTVRNNFQGKPTDTPVWEKNGWLGDANTALTSMIYLYDFQAFFKEFVRTMQDNLHLYGLIPVMVPTAGWYVANLPLWNSVFVFSVREWYQYFGDREFLENIYPDLLTYTRLNIETLEKYDYLWGEHGLDDWVSPVGKADAASFANSSEGSYICVPAFVYETSKTMSFLAEILGRKEEAVYFTEIGQKIKAAFNKKFYKPAECLYDTGVWYEHDGHSRYRTRYRQTSNLLPLAFGLAEEENRQKVFDRLCQDIEKKGYHLDTGCIGTKFVLPVLCDMGRPDLAYKVLTQTTYPSWGYWISQGGDSMWEMWEDTARSRDHYFLGTCEEFFYSHIVGISHIEEGYKSFVIEPKMTEYFSSAGATIDTVRGKLSCYWKRMEDGRVSVKITIPFGAAAKLRLPGYEERELVSGEYQSV